MTSKGKILLVRHTYIDGWYLPGGGVKPHEGLREAAQRELLEEVGLVCGETSLFGVYESQAEGKRDLIFIFQGEVVSEQGAKEGEIEEWKWFDLQSLPEGVSPGTKRRIEEYQSGRRIDSPLAW